MEEKNISSAIVLGWSAGGGTALELAACYPEKVSHLILMASVGVKVFRLAARDEKGNILEGQFLSKREDIIKDPQTMIPITNAIESKDVKFLHWVWEKTIFNLNPPIIVLLLVHSFLGSLFSHRQSSTIHLPIPTIRPESR